MPRHEVHRSTSGTTGATAVPPATPAHASNRPIRRRSLRYTGREISELPRFLANVRAAALSLARGDRSLQDDLRQHAVVVVLSKTGTHTFHFWRSLANWRMRDYARRERRALHHERLPDEADHADAAD